MIGFMIIGGIVSNQLKSKFKKYSKTPLSSSLSGKEIAEKVQFEWDRNFDDPIGFVIGDEWKAGNLSYHLKSSSPRMIRNLKDEISLFCVGVVQPLISIILEVFLMHC